MTVLYITRKYPPSIGGMQKQSYEFNEALKKKADVITIFWSGSQKWFFIFIPLFFTRAVFSLVRSNIDIIQLGDLALSPLGALLKTVSGKTVIGMAHGRDTGYENIFYEAFVISAARKLDGIVCVSANLKERLILRGVKPERLFVVPNGIDPNFLALADKKASRVEIEKEYNLELKNRKVLFSTARFVKKKGIVYFIENILPRILKEDRNILYLIAGDGPEKAAIRVAIKRLGFSDNVKLLGLVRSKDSLQKLYSASDVFIMPNRVVPGDAEGFGIVALEAALCGVRIVAFGVDGVTQAIIDGKTGVLVNAERPDIFAEEVIKTRGYNFGERMARRQCIIDNFSWDGIIDNFLACYAGVKSNKDIYNKIYRKAPSKRIYFKELADFLSRIGNPQQKMVLSIGNGDKEPFFGNEIVSDIAIEDIKKVNSKRRCVFDAHAMPFKAESLDVVYGWQVIHHLDIDKFLPELRFTLRKTGRAVFVDNAYSPQWRLVRRLFKKSSHDPKEDLREEYLQQKLMEHGFINFYAKRYNFFAYLFNKFSRTLGFNLSFSIFERMDDFFVKWPTFRRNLRNMVWSFEKGRTG